jgi:flagellin-specific chaperone FliS
MVNQRKLWDVSIERIEPMQPEQVSQLEEELRQAQEHLDLQMSRFADGDARVTRVQNIIDGLFAILSRAKENRGSVDVTQVNDGLAQLRAEMQQVDDAS